MLNTVEGAIWFATRAHDGQVDKQGLPFVLHPVRVGAALWRFPVEYQIAGFLHDVVEDTYHSLDDLRALGASERVVSAVDALTKRPSEGYTEALERALADPVARYVKAADVADNAARLAGIEDPALFERLSLKYTKAVALLEVRIPGFRLGQPIRPVGCWY